MKRMLSLLAIAASFSVSAAFAEENGALMTYTYGDLEYRHIHLDDAPGIDDTNGLGATVSYEFSKGLYGFVDYGYGNTTLSVPISTSIKHNILSYGAGAYTELADNVHLVGNVYGFYSNYDGLGTQFDDNGLGFNFGFRTLPHELLELDFFANYTNSGAITFQDDWSYNVTALIPLGCDFALKNAVLIDNYSNVGFTSGLRYAF